MSEPVRVIIEKPVEYYPHSLRLFLFIFVGATTFASFIEYKTDAGWKIIFLWLLPLIIWILIEILIKLKR